MIGKGAIIFVLGFGVVLSIMGYRLHTLENQAITNMTYYSDVTTSHNLATAGANTALSILYQDSTRRGVITSQTITSGIFSGGSFTATVDSVSSTKLRLSSISLYKNKYRDTVEVYLDKTKLNYFSMYAWMTNFEGNVFWFTGDTVWGRIHSNGNLHMYGRPVFMEKVTTAKLINPKPGVGTNKAIFKKGYETGVAPIPLPTDLSELNNAAISGGRKYTGNIWITLSAGTSANNDGKVYIRSSESGPIIDSISLSDPTFNGALLATGTVYVKGVVDGRLTIASQTNISIIDDVIYEKNPLITTSDDMLGLVANNNVIVADNTANRSNCEIHASIFARLGSFYAENYSTRPISGWLKIVGGIIQDTRGAVGTFANNVLKTGFLKRYYFDERLSNSNDRPPFFPGFYSQTLNISGWWESVRIPEY